MRRLRKKHADCFEIKQTTFFRKNIKCYFGLNSILRPIKIKHDPKHRYTCITIINNVISLCFRTTLRCVPVSIFGFKLLKN